MKLPRVSELWVPDAGDERDAHFMGLAVRAAAEAFEREEVPVGAVVVHGQRVLAIASNRCEELRDPTAHAEMLALTEACSVLDEGRLVGCELFCTLEPCFMCAGALLHARIERIVFGARDPKFGACRSLATLPEDERLNHRCKVVEGVHADIAAELLRAFFRERRGKS